MDAVWEWRVFGHRGQNTELEGQVSFELRPKAYLSPLSCLMTTSQPTSGFARDVTQCQMQIVTALSGTAHECSVPLLIALIAGGNIIIRVRPDDVLTAQKLASNAS